jgi:hypothetical protein
MWVITAQVYMNGEGDQRQTAELYSDNFELGLDLCRSVHYDLLTCAWPEAGNGHDCGQDAEMIWGEMNWCRRSTGVTTSSAVTHRIRISIKLLLLFYYSSPFQYNMTTEKGKCFIGCHNYFDLL